MKKQFDSILIKFLFFIFKVKKFSGRSNYQYHVNNIHKKLRIDKPTCPHKNCGHKSKSIKQLLMHHDKLEEKCDIEKNLVNKLELMKKKEFHGLML